MTVDSVGYAVKPLVYSRVFNREDAEIIPDNVTKNNTGHDNKNYFNRIEKSIVSQKSSGKKNDISLQNHA